jgi:hypothetical protein
MAGKRGKLIDCVFIAAAMAAQHHAEFFADHPASKRAR